VGRKSDKREARKAKKLERFEAAKPVLVGKVGLTDRPRIARQPLTSIEPHVAPHLLRKLNEDGKSVKVAPTNHWDQPVAWCITKKDVEGKWSWGEPRQWTDAEWANKIEPKFLEYEKLTWSQIDGHSSSTGHKMHHTHELGDLVDEAQIRWRFLGFGQFDTLFRFRLGGKERAWGFKAQAHFHLVWWERHHKIYPVD
jgi:hypothetical protein